MKKIINLPLVVNSLIIDGDLARYKIKLKKVMIKINNIPDTLLDKISIDGKAYSPSPFEQSIIDELERNL